MTPTLAPEQIGELDRIVTEQASGVTPYSDETDRLVWAALPELIAMAKLSLQSGDVLSLADSGIGHYRERAEKSEAEVATLLTRIQSTESALDRAMARSNSWREEAAKLQAQILADQVANPSFQDRVKPWMMTCFGAEISADKVERGDRVLEEVFELMQAVGYDPTRVLALRDYVWGRPIGDPPQETGGVMVTLAAFCLAHGLDMHRAGETELARINQPEIILKIRAKQAAKPTGSALPIAMPPAEGPGACDTCAHQEMLWRIERHHPCAGCTPISLWPNWTPKPIPSTTDKGENL